MNRQGEKPLFIPLRAEYFEAFETGVKNTEYRAYGPRWNEKTCRVGRRATLSYGYSGRRLNRVVSRFQKLDCMEAPYTARQIFPGAPFIAAIELVAGAS